MTFRSWVAKWFGSRRKRAPYQNSRKPRRLHLEIENLETRLQPSGLLQSGGVVHLPFTVSVPEGGAAATVVTSNPDVNATLFDFIDPAGTTSDYQVSITWGDGSSDTFLSTNANAPALVTSTGGGHFHVVPTATLADAHVYEEAAAGNKFTVTVTDVGSGATTGPVSTPFTMPLNVTDPAVTLNSPPLTLTSVNEAISTGTVTVGIFEDPGNLTTSGTDNDSATEYSASIDWGDGTTTSGTIVFAGNDAGNGGASVWDVQGAHTYAEDGLYAVSVSVNHEGILTPNAGSTQTAQITVNEAPATGTPQTLNVTEGNILNVTNVLVGTFTDATNGTDTDYTATVDWGDGDTSTATVSYVGGSVYLIGATKPNAYAEDGTYPVTVTLNDDGVLSTTINSTAIVAESGIGVSALAVSATEGVSTGSVTVATFTDDGNNDPAANYTASVDWGDGSTDSGLTVSQPGGAGTPYVVKDVHTYGEDGSFTTNVTITETGIANGNWSDSNTATVAEAGITVSAAPVAATEGTSTGSITVATFTDGTNSDVPGNYTASVDWGDGNTDSGLVVTQLGGAGTPYVVKDLHTYNEDGSYTINVTITETGITNGGNWSNTTTATVAEAGITVSANPVSATEGVSTGSITVATFTDGGNTDAAGNYTANVDWGDGNTDSGLLVSQPNGPGTAYVVKDVHTYVEDGSYTVNVTITETGITSGTGSGSNTASVAEAGISVTANSVAGTEGVSTGTITVATFTDGGNTDATGNYTASVDWGDGTTDSGLVVTQPGGSGTAYVVQDLHTYNEDGVFTINVTITETGVVSGSGSASNTATMAEATIGVTAAPVAATEGISTGSITVATFTDGINPDAASSYTASVDWGDGVTDNGVPVTQPNGPGTPYVVMDAHTYNEDGPYTTTVTITETGVISGGGWSNSNTATVAEAGILVTANPVAIAEGNSTGSITVATFTDGGNTDAAANYTASVDWGDGNTDSGLVVTQPGGAGTAYVVKDLHTYNEDGSYTINVTITETGITSGTGSGSTTATVAEAGIGVFTNGVFATEGLSTGSITVATFTDGSNSDAPGNYTASVDWGDGNTDSGLVVTQPGGSGTVYVVKDQHTYAEDSVYLVAVTVTETGIMAGSGSNSNLAFVGEASVTGQTPQTLSVIEGNTTGLSSVVVASFTDGSAGTDSDFTATVDWGDGTTSTGTVSFSGGAYQVTASKPSAYAEDGSYTVAVAISDDSSLATTINSTATVAEASLGLTINAVSATEGTSTGSITVATFTDSGNTDAAGNYTASVDWGDGTTDAGLTVTQPGGVGTPYVVKDLHTYNEDGSYTVNVTITETGITAGTVGGSNTATVAEAGISVTANPVSGTESASTGLFTVATFTDGGNTDAAGNYTASVDWGDGVTDSGLVVTQPGGSGTPYVVQDLHTYNEDGVFTINVAVTETGVTSGSGSGSNTATMAEAGITVSASPVAATEGVSSGSITVATFTDGTNADASGSYTASVDWGDGTTDNGVAVTQPNGPGTAYVVKDLHTYLEDGAYTTTVTISETGIINGANWISSSTATVAEAGINVSVNPVAGSEVVSTGLTTVATFTDGSNTDAPANYTASVDWGDGTTDSGLVVTQPGGPGTAYFVTDAHTYTNDGSYTIAVAVTETGITSGTGIGTNTASIAEAGIGVTANPVSATEGSSTGTITVATFTDDNNMDAPGSYTASVDWGDGTTDSGLAVTQPGGPGTPYVVQDLHTYNEDGSYTLNVTITETGVPLGGGWSDSNTATVAEAHIGVTANPLSPTEGVSTGSITVATFTDGVNTDAPGNYTASVDWGDGSTDSNLVVTQPNGPGTAYVIKDLHTYTEDGSYTVNVSVTETGITSGSGWASSTSATVSEAGIEVAVNPVAATEGTSTGSITVATFTDDSNADAPGNYSASVDWGDGSTDNGLVVTQPNGAGTAYVVKDLHTYTEDGLFTLNVTVTETGVANGTGSGSNTANVAEPAINIGSGTSVSGAEGFSPGSIVVGTFTHANGVESASNFVATIDWGDGNFSVGTVFQPGGVGTAYVVTGSNTYAEEGNYTIQLDISEDSGTVDSGFVVTGTATISDPAVVANAGPAISAQEAASTGVVLLATFTDPAGPEALTEYAATTDWGDGTGADNTPFILYNGAGTFYVFGTHTFATNSPAGGFTVTTTIHHFSEVLPNPVDTIVTQTATVSDQQLTNLTSNVPSSAQEWVSTGTITGIAGFSDPGDPNGTGPTSDYAATIYWGDGTTSLGTVNLVNENPQHGDYSVDAPAHAYAEEGTYAVYTLIQHLNEAPVSTPVQFITVSDRQISTPVAANLPATAQENASLGAISSIATFTDPAGGEAAADYTATIDWGDGTTATGVIRALSANSFAVDAPAHTYLDEGSYTVSVSVQHDALAALTSNIQTINITDPLLTNLTSANLPAAGVEGVAVAAISGIATFTDPAGVGAETSADFVATISWGDGATDAGTVISLGGGNYVVNAPSHTYAEEGVYTVGVTINHDGLGAQSAGTQTITIADQPITGLVASNLPASASENTATGIVTGIATFSDPAGVGVETTADFNAVINWGDGSTDAGTVNSLGNGNYSVDAPSHTYVAEGTYTVTVRVQHDALPALTSNVQTIVVGDQQITTPVLNAANLPASVQEGVAVGAITSVATFTDPAGIGAETTADFTATIDWGDGSTSLGTVNAIGGGTYSIDAPAHTYVEEGNYSLSVTVQHDALAPVTSSSAVIAVADQALTNVTSANLPSTGLEGVALGTIFGIASFTDPAGVGVETSGDFTATVSWGDGATDAGTVVSLGGGNYTVMAPAHTYAEEGNYTVGVTITHDALAPQSAPNQTIAIADQAITGLSLTGVPTVGVEGVGTGAITGLAHFVDPAGAGSETTADFTATINWGDGSTSAGTLFSPGGGNYRIDTTGHTYAEEGVYAVSVTVKHDALPPLTSNTQLIVVADQQISAPVLASLSISGQEGAALSPISGIATLTDPAGVGAEASADFTATIDWGDGTTSLGTVNSTGGGSYSVDAPAHTYAEEGNYTVSVTVQHDSLAPVASSNTLSIGISDQQLTNLASANLPATATEGAAIAPVTGIASFTDPAGTGVETVADYTAVINWGDGTTSAGTIVALGNGNYRVDAPAHTYAEENTYTVNVTLTHDLEGAVVTPDQSITVNDPSVVVSGFSFNALAGTQFTGQTVAAFTDPGGAELTAGQPTPGEYSATIDWGDNTATSAGTITYSNGIFTVTGDHTYATTGLYQVTVTVKHGTAAAATASSASLVLPAPASKLALVNMPASVAAGQPFSFQVDIEDAQGNLVTNNNSNVTVSLTGTSFASGSTTVQAVGGVATFSDMVINQAGGPYTLTVSDGTLTPDSAQLSVTPAAVGTLTFVNVPASALADLPVSTFQVEITDPFGNVITSDNSQVTVSVPGVSGSSMSVNAVNGVATFSNFVIKALGSLTLQATDASLFPAISSAINVTFADNFNQPNGSVLNPVLWSFHLGNLTIENNAAVGTSNKNYAVANYLVQKDVIVTGTLNVGPTTKVGSGGGLIARAQLQGEGNFYYGALFKNSAGQLVPYIKIMSGDGTALKILAKGSPIKATSGPVVFEVVGSSLKLFFNGSLVAFAHDTTLGSGSVGMRVNPGSSWSNYTASAATTSNAALPFSDDFSTPGFDSQLSSFWTDQSGNFTIQGSSALGTGTYNVSTVNSLFANNVTVQATLAGSSSPNAGLIARYSGHGQDDADYYMAALVRKGSKLTPTIYLHRTNGTSGTFIVLNSGVAFTPSGAETVKFVVSGTSLQMFVNGTMVASATNSALSLGTVGMRSVNPGAGWSNFSAQ